MTTQYQGPIKLIVLDVGGCVVDGPQDLSDTYAEDDGIGVKAPVIALDETLQDWGIDLSWEQIREPMGLYKKDHLRELLTTEEARRQFEAAHGREWREGDLEEMFASFSELQTEVIVREELARPIRGARETIETLRGYGKLISNTTGYTENAAEALYAKLVEDHGISFDFKTHSDAVPAGRPGPWMIQQGMRELSIQETDAVIKVGDTTKDIEAGLNAGVWTVGVYSTGNDGFDHLRDAGADYLIPSIRELPEVVWEVENRMARGEH
ncbi:MAG: HAD-IA family hydrolase [Halobacteriales archaeon]